ncbi:MAG: ABC transporter substrate-binding protein [Hyphomicrobiaceae bacterium]
MAHPVRVYENLRGVVYTPFYLASVDGDWRDLGLDVEVIKSPATSETAIGLMAGRVDVSWGGPMRVMMHHDEDPACPLMCFGQVVSRDPFMLVGRETLTDFRFRDLAGKRIAVASDVPTPWLTFQDDLQRAGIDPASLERVDDRPMAENAGRLKAGEIDVMQVFEPYASQAVADGYGHIWHRFAVRGDVAFTTFYATRTYMDENPAVCETLVKGIGHALTRMYAMPIDELAAKVAPYFPDLDERVLAAAIDGYREAGLWAREPSLPVTAIVRLKAALLSGGFIRRDMPYDAIARDIRG